MTQFSWYTQTMKRYDNIGFMSIFFFAYFFLAWIALAFGKFTKR